MKITPKIAEVINKQINSELGAQYTYMGMQAWFESTPYEGFARWMKIQADEEHGHARRFFSYLNERGGRVELMPLDAPKCAFQSPLEAFQAALAHEEKVTGQIEAIYDLALREKDYLTAGFLNWFLEEQVEEEDNARRIVEKLEAAGDNLNAVMALDRAAAAREEE